MARAGTRGRDVDLNLSETTLDDSWTSSSDSESEQNETQITPRSVGSNDSSACILTPRSELLWDHGYEKVNERQGVSSPEEREREWRSFNKTDDDKLYAGKKVKKSDERRILGQRSPRKEKNNAMNHSPRSSSDLPDLISSMSSSTTNRTPSPCCSSSVSSVAGTPPPLPDSDPPSLPPPLPASSPPTLLSICTGHVSPLLTIGTEYGGSQTWLRILNNNQDDSQSTPLVSNNNDQTDVLVDIESDTVALDYATSPTHEKRQFEVSALFYTEDNKDNEGLHDTDTDHEETETESITNEPCDILQPNQQADEQIQISETDNGSQESEDIGSNYYLSRFNDLLEFANGQNEEVDPEIEAEFEAILHSLDVTFTEETYIERFAGRRDRYGFILSPITERPTPSPSSSISGFSGVSSSPDQFSAFRMSPCSKTGILDMDLSSLQIDGNDLEFDDKIPIYRAKKVMVIPECYGWDSEDDILSGSGEWDKLENGLSSPPVSSTSVNLSQFGKHVKGWRQPDGIIIEEGESSGSESDDTVEDNESDTESSSTLNEIEEKSSFDTDRESDTEVNDINNSIGGNKENTKRPMSTEEDTYTDDETSASDQLQLSLLDEDLDEVENVLQHLKPLTNDHNIDTQIKESEDTDDTKCTHNDLNGETTEDSVITNEKVNVPKLERLSSDEVHENRTDSGQSIEYSDTNDDNCDSSDDAEDEYSDTESDKEFDNTVHSNYLRSMVSETVHDKESDRVCVKEILTPRSALKLVGSMLPVYSDSDSSSDDTDTSSTEEVDPNMSSYGSGVRVTMYTSDSDDSRVGRNKQVGSETRQSPKSAVQVSFRSNINSKDEVSKGTQYTDSKESALHIISPLNFSVFDNVNNPRKSPRSPKVFGRYYDEIDKDIIDQTSKCDEEKASTEDTDSRYGITHEHDNEISDQQENVDDLESSFRHITLVKSPEPVFSDLTDLTDTSSEEDSDSSSEKDESLSDNNLESESYKGNGFKRTNVTSIQDNGSLDRYVDQDSNNKINPVSVKVEANKRTVNDMHDNESSYTINAAVDKVKHIPPSSPNVDQNIKVDNVLTASESKQKGDKVSSNKIVPDEVSRKPKPRDNRQTRKAKSNSPVHIKVCHLGRSSSARAQVRKGFVHELSVLFNQKNEGSKPSDEVKIKHADKFEDNETEHIHSDVLLPNENITFIEATMTETKTDARLRSLQDAEIDSGSLGFEVTPFERVRSFSPTGEVDSRLHAIKADFDTYSHASNEESEDEISDEIKQYEAQLRQNDEDTNSDDMTGLFEGTTEFVPEHRPEFNESMSERLTDESLPFNYQESKIPRKPVSDALHPRSFYTVYGKCGKSLSYLCKGNEHIGDSELRQPSADSKQFTRDPEVDHMHNVVDSKTLQDKRHIACTVDAEMSTYTPDSSKHSGDKSRNANTMTQIMVAESENANMFEAKEKRHIERVNDKTIPMPVKEEVNRSKIYDGDENETLQLTPWSKSRNTYTENRKACIESEDDNQLRRDYTGVSKETMYCDNEANSIMNFKSKAAGSSQILASPKSVERRVVGHTRNHDAQSTYTAYGENSIKTTTLGNSTERTDRTKSLIKWFKSREAEVNASGNAKGPLNETTHSRCLKRKNDTDLAEMVLNMEARFNKSEKKDIYRTKLTEHPERQIIKPKWHSGKKRRAPPIPSVDETVSINVSKPLVIRGSSRSNAPDQQLQRTNDREITSSGKRLIASERDRFTIQYPASLSKRLYGPYCRVNGIESAADTTRDKQDARDATRDALLSNASLSESCRPQILTGKHGDVPSRSIDSFGQSCLSADEVSNSINQNRRIISGSYNYKSHLQDKQNAYKNAVVGSDAKKTQAEWPGVTSYDVKSPFSITKQHGSITLHSKPINSYKIKETKLGSGSDNSAVCVKPHMIEGPRAIHGTNREKVNSTRFTCFKHTAGSVTDLPVHLGGRVLSHARYEPSGKLMNIKQGGESSLKDVNNYDNEGLARRIPRGLNSWEESNQDERMEDSTVTSDGDVYRETVSLRINEPVTGGTVGSINQPQLSNGHSRQHVNSESNGSKEGPEADDEEMMKSPTTLHTKTSEYEHVLEDEKGNLKLWPYSDFDNSDKLPVTLYRARKGLKVRRSKDMLLHDQSNMTVIQSGERSSGAPDNRMVKRYHSSEVLPSDGSQSLMQTHGDSVESVLFRDTNGNNLTEEELASIMPKLASTVSNMKEVDAEEILPGITQSVTQLRNGGNLVITTMTRKVDEDDSDSSGRGSPTPHPVLNVDDLENSKIYLVQDSKGELFYVEDVTSETQESAYYSSTSRHNSESVSDGGSSPSTSHKISKIRQVGESGINESTAEEILSAMYDQTDGVQEITENEEEWSERTYEYDFPKRRNDPMPGQHGGYSKDSFKTAYMVEEPDTMPRTRVTTTKDKMDSTYEMSGTSPWLYDGGSGAQNFSVVTQGLVGGEGVESVSAVSVIDQNNMRYAQTTANSSPGITRTVERFTIDTEELPQVQVLPPQPPVPLPPFCVQGDIPQYSLVKVDVSPKTTASVSTNLPVIEHNKRQEVDDRPIYKTVAHIQAGEKQPPVSNEMTEKKYKIVSSSASSAPAREEEIQESHMTLGDLDYKYSAENVEYKMMPAMQQKQVYVRNSTHLDNQERFRSEKRVEIGNGRASDQKHRTEIRVQDRRDPAAESREDSSYSYDEMKAHMENSATSMKVVRGSYLIKNNLDEVDTTLDDNINMFDGKFTLCKENPLYQSDEDLYRKLEREKQQSAQRQERFQRDFNNDLTFETVDRFSRSKTVKREEERRPKQSLQQLLLTRLSSIDSRDIRSSVDVKHHSEDIYGDPSYMHADGSADSFSRTGTNNFESVGEKVDLLIKDGKAYITVTVTAEKVTPVDLEFNVWRKNQAIVTRTIEVDLLATEQRRRLYYKVMEEPGTRSRYRGGLNETVLDGGQTLELFTRILGAADGEGDNEDITVRTSASKTTRPFNSGMDLLY